MSLIDTSLSGTNRNTVFSRTSNAGSDKTTFLLCNICNIFKQLTRIYSILIMIVVTINNTGLLKFIMNLAAFDQYSPSLVILASPILPLSYLKYKVHIFMYYEYCERRLVITFILTHDHIILLSKFVIQISISRYIDTSD